MTIEVGQRLPNATLRMKTGDKVDEVATDQYFKGRKIVLVGVPGAFTPTCHANHLPGYLQNLDALAEAGVDRVAIVSVNDPHVMAAWAKASGAEGKIDFLADGAAEFTKALGLDYQTPMMGIRSKRYSMLVDAGVVETFNLEATTATVTDSAAVCMVEQLAV